VPALSVVVLELVVDVVVVLLELAAVVVLEAACTTTQLPNPAEEMNWTRQRLRAEPPEHSVPAGKEEII